MSPKLIPAAILAAMMTAMPAWAGEGPPLDQGQPLPLARHAVLTPEPDLFAGPAPNFTANALLHDLMGILLLTIAAFLIWRIARAIALQWRNSK